MKRLRLVFLSVVFLVVGACNTASSPPAAIDNLALGITAVDGVTIQPPVGPTEVLTGNFDDEVPLVIELYRLNNRGAILISPSFATGDGSIVVTNTAEREDYQANWHTRQSRLGDGTRVRVVVRLADADDAGCAASVDAEDMGEGCLAYFDVELVRNLAQVRRTEPGVHYRVNGSTLPIRVHIAKADVPDPPIDDTPFELENLTPLGGGEFDEGAGNCPVYDFEVPGQGLHAVGTGLHAVGTGLHAVGTVGGLTVDHPRPLDPVRVGFDITDDPFAEIELDFDTALLVVDDFGSGIYRLGSGVFDLSSTVTESNTEQGLENLRTEMERLVEDDQLSHGAVVLHHTNRIIQGTWYWHSTTSSTSGDEYIHELSHADSDEVASKQLIVKAVNIHGITDSEEIAQRVQAATSALGLYEIDHIVVNMSFALIPCSVKDDFISAEPVTFEAYNEALARLNNRRSEAVAEVISTPVGEDPLHDLIKAQARAYTEGGHSIINVASSGNFSRGFSMFPGAWPEVVSVSSQDVDVDFDDVDVDFDSDVSDWRYGGKSGFSNDGKIMALGAWFELVELEGDSGLGTASNHLNPVAYAGTSFAGPAVSAFSAIDFMTGVTFCGLDANGIPKLARGPLNNTPLLLPGSLFMTTPAIDSYCPSSMETETHIVLTWGDDPIDLDAHLTGPVEGSDERFHIYWNHQGSPESPPFAFLDVDVTTSSGPETITITRRFPGVYRYSVHDFTNRLAAASAALAGSGATVSVLRNGSEIANFTVPNQGGTLWTVFEMDGATGHITPVNAMSDQSDPSAIQALVEQAEGSIKVR